MTENTKPLTRDEVLKMIEKNGRPNGLDLSGRNLEGIDLSTHSGNPRLDLHGIILSLANLQGAKLWATNLQGANLVKANMQKAELLGTDLQGAVLVFANLEGADFSRAKLAKAKLQHAVVSRETKLESVDWGPNCILGEEDSGKFEDAVVLYRLLKQWYTQEGIYDMAGEFFFREMTVRRKTMKWWPNPLPRVWSKFLSILAGYGEKPFRVIASAAVIILGLAGIYSISELTVPSSLYYSAVSFVALGYGGWVATPAAWVRAWGALEAFIGVFMMALFLVTFTRKMSR